MYYKQVKVERFLPNFLSLQQSESHESLVCTVLLFQLVYDSEIDEWQQQNMSKIRPIFAKLFVFTTIYVSVMGKFGRHILAFCSIALMHLLWNRITSTVIVSIDFEDSSSVNTVMFVRQLFCEISVHSFNRCSFYGLI